MAPLRVAILDDEEAVLAALGRLLRVHGAEVGLFLTTQDFLETLQWRRADCVVSDLHIPDLGALGLQRKLTVLAPGTPMIVITGDDSPQARQEAIDSGVHAYLGKPVDAEVLLAAIVSATGRAAC